MLDLKKKIGCLGSVEPTVPPFFFFTKSQISLDHNPTLYIKFIQYLSEQLYSTWP